jgi:phosphatidylserine/phosphatidylglycerophosphate/cardiolipin synthase-like enzyme
LVGSRNLTSASLDKNREESVLLVSPVIPGQLEATFGVDWPAA